MQVVFRTGSTVCGNEPINVITDDQGDIFCFLTLTERLCPLKVNPTKVQTHDFWFRIKIFLSIEML